MPEFGACRGREPGSLVLIGGQGCHKSDRSPVPPVLCSRTAERAEPS